MTKPVKLTKRQQEILDLIQSHIHAAGSPPTRAEIAKTMGFRSPNAAEDHLRALARKGVIELVPGTSRGIRLLKMGGDIPLVKMDRILSNQPILSEPHLDGTCKLDRNFFKPSIDFLLQVSHKGYPELHIAAGDYLAIHQTQEIPSGQLALTRLNHEINIQRYTTDNIPQNLIIEGLVIGIIRTLNHASLR
ncbi:MAG TPA: transcriptional repressor LexA [Gammaproteobacteria bacterium]|nr:transcriptional repressor LexA [Gammaproteobacteria bacterium]